jgi:hypothetical protein
MASALLSACSTPEEPQRPDLDWLVAAYENPTAELELSAVSEALREALPALRSVQALDNVRFVLQSLDDASAGLMVKGLDAELQADIEGHADIHVICPGDQPDQADLAPDAERDGTLSLRVQIRQAALQPVITGTASRCRIRELPEALRPSWLPESEEPLRAELDGALAIHTGVPLVLGRETTLRPIFRIDGTLRVADLPPLQHFDFRIPAADSFEIRIPIGEEHVILVLTREGVAIRERRGEWVCQSAMEGACAQMF